MKVFKSDKKFYLDFRFRDVRYRMVAFKTEKQSQRLGDTIDRLIDIRQSDDVISQDLQKAVDCLPTRIVRKLAIAGLVSTSRTAGKNQLSEHIKDFIESLKIKRVSELYLFNIKNLINRVCKKCSFNVISDLDANAFIAYVNGLTISAKTKKEYIAGFKQFTKWLQDNGKMPKNNFGLIELPRVLQSDQRHPRRALTADDVAKLILTAENGKPFRKITGKERALIYRLAVEDGLRYNEIKTLKVSDFDFKNNSVTVRDENEKARRGAVLPLRQSTSAMLKDFLRNKTPQSMAFSLREGKGSLMIQVDLKAAGIEYEDEAGRYADFHSLRHTTASLLIQTGVNPKVIQSIMRHSNLLTMQRYTHLYVGQSQQAIESLPDFVVKQEALAKTGTDDCSVENNCPKTAHEDKQNLTILDNSQNATLLGNDGFGGVNSKESALLAEKSNIQFLDKNRGDRIRTYGLLVPNQTL